MKLVSLLHTLNEEVKVEVKDTDTLLLAGTRTVKELFEESRKYKWLANVINREICKIYPVSEGRIVVYVYAW